MPVPGALKFATSPVVPCLMTLALGCGTDHPDDPSRLFEEAYEERKNPKGDALRCSGVVVPDRGGFGGRVALTFDDGPNPETTPRILEVLKRRDVPATFFINGSRVASDETREILAEIVSDSRFLLGNHTWSHRDMRQLSTDAAVAQIDDTTQVIENAGAAPLWFRFPYGASTCATAELVRDRGYTVTGWHIDSADWCFAHSHGRCEEGTFAWVPDELRGDMKGWVMQQVREHDGGIVLFHDVHPLTASSIESIIDALEVEGYELVGIDDAGTFPVLNGVEPAPDFIGDPCDGDDGCRFAGSFCLGASDESPGMCTAVCTSTCPDRAGYPVTRCVRRPGDVGTGDLCAVSCGDGCPDGTACRVLGSPSGIEREVCWPE